MIEVNIDGKKCKMELPKNASATLFCISMECLDRIEKELEEADALSNVVDDVYALRFVIERS